MKEEKVKFEHKLLEKNKGMTLSASGKELHGKKLRDLFNKIWSENIYILLLFTLPFAEVPDIYIKLENLLLEHFKHPNIVNKTRYCDTKKTVSFYFKYCLRTSDQFSKI